MSFPANSFTRVVRIRPALGKNINQRPYTVAASQTIYKGDFVSLDSSGNVQQAISLPGSNSTGTLSGGNLPWVGVALSDITTNASGIEAATGRTTIDVAIADANLEILLRTYNSTAANSEVQDTVIGQTSGTVQFGRWRDASSSVWWYYAGTTGTNGEIKQTEKYPDQAVTDDYGLAWYRAVMSETQRQA